MSKYTQALVFPSVWELQCRDGGEAADACPAGTWWHLCSWPTTASPPPRSAGSHHGKKALCKMFAQRQTLHSKHSCFFNGKKKLKGENQHGVNISVPWRLCFAAQGWFSSPLPHHEHPTQREVDSTDRLVSWVQKEGKRAWRCKTEIKLLLGKLSCMKLEGFPVSCDF